MSGVYAMGVERAKAYGRITRLSVGAGAQADELDKVFREIGRLYYEQNAGHAAGLFVPLFDQVKAIRRAHPGENAEEIKAIKAISCECKDKGPSTTRPTGWKKRSPSFDDVVDATTEDGIQ